MEYSLGVDFGTSTTKIALCQMGRNPQLLPIGSRRDYYMPSVVRYRRTNQGQADPIAVGEDALTDTVTEDMAVVKEIKRLLIGEKEQPSDPIVRNRYSNWDWENGVVRLWSSVLDPHEIAMTIVEEALKRAIAWAKQEGFGDKVNTFSIRGFPCRIGCPVKSKLDTRLSLAEMARRLGFHSFSISRGLYDEPILASLEYLRHDTSTEGATVLVYDFGGGSFDTAIVKIIGTGIQKRATVLSSDGEPFCGGGDMDHAFRNYLVERIAKDKSMLQYHNGQQLLAGIGADAANILANRTREIKETLSTMPEIALSLDFLGLRDEVIEVTQSELNKVIGKTNIVSITTACTLRNFWRARMFDRKPGESLRSYYLHEESGILKDHVMDLTHKDLSEYVDKILLVGGTTKMPLVRETLGQIWDNSKFISANVVEPVEACAMGAASTNDVAFDSLNRRSIIDRLPFSVILSGDRGEFTAYKAFEPIVRYERRPMKEYRSETHINSRTLSIFLKSPDGDITPCKKIQDGIPPYQLCFDIFGNMFLKDSLKEVELKNPCQSDKQQAMYEWKLAKERHDSAAEREAFEKYLKEKAGEQTGGG
jgi:molecular chaperone DnaK (HSP70)